jgi:hypothetical protein
MSLHVMKTPFNNTEQLVDSTTTVFVVGAGASVAAGLPVNYPHWLSLGGFSQIPIDLQKKFWWIHRCVQRLLRLE